MNILIIGVDSDTVADLMAALNESDYQIIKVNNGHEALKMIRTSSKRYQPVDLIVVGQQLPDMPGFALIQAVKEDMSGISAILVTVAIDYDIEKALEDLSCRYVEKGGTHRNLIQTIQEIKWRLKNPYYEVGF